MRLRRFPVPGFWVATLPTFACLIDASAEGALPGGPAVASKNNGATAAAAAAAAAAGSNTSSASSGALFLESCRQALGRGRSQPGCQGTFNAGELHQLKEEALRTNNAQLLTLIGDAYQNNRTSQTDVGQAFRWYVLGAVRGDPRAMQRLSDLYRAGNGGPDDKVKALGYARLARRLAAPGSSTAAEAARAARRLGGQMAAEELTLADGFVDEFEKEIQRRSAGNSAATGASSTPARRLDMPGLTGARQAESADLAPTNDSPASPGTSRDEAKTPKAP